ncbi:MAG: SPOR domain-containing protein, partial [Hymenobacter sp.]|nr:SPOR domain-containing protein [Hymenobacter sp.]
PLLTVAGRTARTARLLRVALSAVVVGLVFSANYMFADQLGYLPDALRMTGPASEESAPQPATPTAPVIRSQQAALATADNFEPARPVEKPAARPAGGKPVASKPAAGRKAAAPAAAVSGEQKPKPAKGVVRPAVKAPGWEKAAAATATPVTAATAIKSPTGRYYVIAGSYTSMINAEKGRQALVRLGHPARIITPPAGSRQYKLSVADFTDRTSADRQATILRKRMGTTLWVLNY